MTQQQQAERAAALRAQLQQTEAELATTQQRTEELLLTIQTELRRISFSLADTQMELIAKKAWEGGQA